MVKYDAEYFIKFKCSCGFVMYEDPSKSVKQHTCPACKSKMTKHICAQIKESPKCQTSW